jgi:hypothetical protein
MLDFFDRLYESTDFMPHGECLVWDTALLWQHAGSDIGTGIAYYLIGAVLFYFIFIMASNVDSIAFLPNHHIVMH